MGAGNFQSEPLLARVKGDLVDELDPAVQLGVAANVAKHYATQGRDLLAPLARLLGDVLGERVETQMAGGFLQKKVLSGLSLRSANGAMP